MIASGILAAADELHRSLLEVGVDVALDDRGERPGAMFADWELIGVPHRVAIGERSLKDNLVEYQGRQDLQSTPVPIDQIRDWLVGKLAA